MPEAHNLKEKRFQGDSVYDQLHSSQGHRGGKAWWSKAVTCLVHGYWEEEWEVCWRGSIEGPGIDSTAVPL